jgi:DNA repair photolyase
LVYFRQSKPFPPFVVIAEFAPVLVWNDRLILSVEAIRPLPSHDCAYNIALIIREVQTKSILSKSQVYPYVINPYTGCQHSCSYCYARFMKRFTGHKEPWGQFVDVKINAPQLLQREIIRKKPHRVWVSGVCDPYQPFEARYQLTRQCLQILAENSWPVSIQTRSPLVMRDLDILQEGMGVEVGFSITTADDAIRKLFEPNAPPIMARLKALDQIHQAGVRTFVMIAPILPRAESLAEVLADKVDYVIFDRMNYHHADWVYRKYNLQAYQTDEYFTQVEYILASSFAKNGVKI